MIVNIVHVYVKKMYVNDFIEITRYNHENTIKEPGNLRFDVLQDEAEPTKFVLYEAFETENAAKAHKETDHYNKWRETVAGWMDKPRQGIKHQVLFPTDEALW